MDANDHGGGKGTNDKPLDASVTVTLDGRRIEVGTVRQAADLLIDVNWPERGPRHREATDACLKVLEGYRSTDDARTAFIAAAEEADILDAG